MAKDFLYCESTDTKIYANDVVMISTYPDVKWIAKNGWYKFGTAQKRGWYFISIVDKTILPIDQVDLETISKDIEQGTSELRPTLKDIDATPAEVDYIVIPGTNIRLYDSDVVKISNKPRVKWIVHNGWYIYKDVQNFGWYLVSIKNGDILPVSEIDLTLCSLVTTKTQGSEKYDGKVVNYTRPFTEADAETLNRTFITLDTLDQRANLDPNKLVDGRIVRINDVGGAPAYYSWNASTKEWDIIDNSNQGIPELIGTTKNPIILSKLEPGLYRVKGTYKIAPDYDMITLTGIDHIAFVSEDDNPQIKVITDAQITDYVVTGNNVTFVNKYATYKYLDDNYATITYVNNAITVIEAQISEIISELHDLVVQIVNETLDDALNSIPDSYIDNLFD